MGPASELLGVCHSPYSGLIPTHAAGLSPGVSRRSSSDFPFLSTMLPPTPFALLHNYLSVFLDYIFVYFSKSSEASAI